MVKLGEIFNRRSGIFRFKSVDDYQFDFHTLGKHTFYINTGVAAVIPEEYSARPAKFGVSSTKIP